MSGADDDTSWLDEPALPDVVELPCLNEPRLDPNYKKNKQTERDLAHRVDQSLSDPVAAARVSNGKKSREEFVVAYKKLEGRKKEFLQALVQAKFIVGSAVKALRKTGTTIATQSHARWLAQDETYSFVYNTLKARMRQQVVDKDMLVLHAENIRQQAMKGKPILYKGEDTGFRENKPDTALRAVELLMKTQKMLGNDQETQTQGNGPPLIIQIVQSDNKVVDVTNGVTIDLPVPDAS